MHVPKFYKAGLYKVDFSRANLSRVDFRGVKNLKDVIWDNGTGKACADEKPIFDEGDEISFNACQR